MQKTCRKRKNEVSDKPNQKEYQSPMKIKTELVDDVAALGLGCCLCSSSFGVELLSLFEGNVMRTEPEAVEQMKICIGQEFSSGLDRASRICSTCLQTLNEHHSFWQQALKCNNYSLNQMVESKSKLKDADIRNCRFCLQIEGELFNLFSAQGVSNERQLKNIRECLSVQVNYSDHVTKVCGSCIRRIQSFLDFRRKHEPKMIFPKRIQDNTPKHSEFDFIGNKAIYLAQENKKRKVRNKPKLEDLDAETKELLLADVKGRNFDAVLENGSQLKVTYNDYHFEFHVMAKNGSTIWNCKESKLQKCGVRLKIDSSGKNASIASKFKKHGHPVISPKLLQCPFGKGFVQSGFNEPFWLCPSQQNENDETRSLIYGGFRYDLDSYKYHEQISEWHCDRRTTHCFAVLTVHGIFNQVQMIGSHNHAALEQEHLKDVLKGCPIDKETMEAIKQFQLNNPLPLAQKEKSKTKKTKIIKENKRKEVKSVLKEKNPSIYRILQQNDGERTFECVTAGSKLKIIKEGYEYRYLGTLEDKSTLWRCIMNALHHCLIIAKISKDGKRFEIFQGGRHSHSTDPAPIFGYPLGKRMVGAEPLCLIKRVSIYYESRYVIYQDNIFVLRAINKKGLVRMCCWSNNKCAAFLIVKGDFADVCLIKQHTHEKISENIITRLIEGRAELLDPDEDLTLKQKLLSFPSMKGQIWDEVQNEYETFYILNKVKKMDKIGHGLLFRGFRYSFVSIDQYGTSRWLCIKYDECRVTAIMEGIYETIHVREEHVHEMMLDSEIDLLIQKCANNLSDDVEGSSLVDHATKNSESSNVLSILARPDPDRNFTVTRLKTKLLIHFDGDEYRIDQLKSDGTSLWFCTWLKLKKCKVVLRLNADGKQVSLVDPQIKHNHSEEHKALFYLSCGKGFVFDKYLGADRCYWLYSVQSEYRKNRAIIYQGYKYYLHLIGKNNMSTWKCYIQNCSALVHIEGCFKVILNQSRHSHDPLSNREVFSITGFTIVDEDLLPDSTTQNIASLKGPLRQLALLNLFSKNDSDRNFQVLIKKKKVKIIHNNYTYSFDSTTETHSRWKCIHSFIRQCDAILQIDHNGKQGILSEGLEHNHSSELWDIFHYPIGNNEIMDISSKSAKPLLFLMVYDFICPIPILIFDQNKHKLTSISKNGDKSKWRCTGTRCKAILTVNGMFESIDTTENCHKHKPASEEKIANWIKKCGGSKEDLDNEEIDATTFEEFPIDIEDTIKREEQ